MLKQDSKIDNKVTNLKVGDDQSVPNSPQPETDSQNSQKINSIKEQTGQIVDKATDNKLQIIQNQKPKIENLIDEYKEKSIVKEIQDLKGQKDIIDFIDMKSYLQKEKLNRFEKEIFVNTKHTRKITKYQEEIGVKQEKYTFSEIIKKNTGWSFLGFTSKTSDLVQFGTGVSLYFKYVKLMGFMFIFFLFLSIPQFLVSTISYNQASPTSALDTANSFIAQLSIGSVGMGLQQCLKLSLDINSVEEPVYEMYCSSGEINMEKSLLYGYVNEAKQGVLDCGFITKQDLIQDCNYQIDSEYLQNTKLWNICHKQQNCKFQSADLQEIFRQDGDCSKYESNNSVYISVMCDDMKVDMGFLSEIKADTGYKLIIFFNIGIIAIFYIILVTLPKSQRATQRQIDKLSFTVNNFTIQMTNLPELPEKALIIELHNYFENQFQEQLKKQQENTVPIKVIDIKLAETNKEINLTRQMGTIQQQIIFLLYQFLNKYDERIEEQQDVLDNKFKNIPDLSRVTPQMLEQFKEKYIQSEKDKQNAQKIIDKIKLLMQKAKNIEDQINQTEDSFHKFKMAWVTFETVQQKQQVFDAIYITPIRRFLLKMCGCCMKKPQFFIQNKMIILESEAVSPINILWENIYESTQSVILRRSISFIITLILLAIAFFVTQQINNYQDDLKDKYPVIDCTLEQYQGIQYPDLPDQEKQLIIQEYEYQQNPDNTQEVLTGFIQCFCQETVSNGIRKTLEDKELDKICEEWYFDYGQMLVLPWLLAFLLIMINFMIRIMLQILSKIEKYEHLTAELNSKILKIFIALFINTGLIILISNMDPLTTNQVEEKNDVEKQFSGQYKDLNPNWFYNVGYMLVFTMFLQIGSVIGFALLFQFLRFYKKFKDRGYKCKNIFYQEKGPFHKDNLNTRQITQNQWLNIYLGPEFLIDFRYAQTIMVIFVTLFYSSSMPILYLTTALYFFVLYWIDKIWLFKIYQIPKNLDSSMANLIINILYFAPCVHLIMAIYIYGNSNIFYSPSEYDPEEIDKNHIEKFAIRMFNNYNNVTTIILFVSVGIVILRLFFFKPFQKIISLCFPDKESSKEDQEGFQKPFWDFLGKNQVVQEIKLLNVSIKEEESDPTPNVQLINIMQKRLEKLQKIVKTQNKTHLIGLFSYDIRHNPNYKNIFNWEARIDSTGLEDLLAGALAN